MSSKKSIDEVSKAMGLMEMDTHKLVDLIKHDILMSLYRSGMENGSKITLSAEDKQLNAKIQAVYKEWTGNEFDYDPSHKNLSMFLMGPPGQGKTTTFKEAAKEVCEAVGLKLVVNPDDNYKPSKEDFVFASLECSGENSAITFGGLPSKVEEEGPGGEKLTYMTKVPNKRMALLSQVAGGVLLLDDFSNAAPNVQNVALSLTDEKRFQGLNLAHTYVGLTGNLGAIDGTHTTKNSTALSSRCILVFTRDDVKNFEARTQKRFKNDDIGDAGILAFLQRNPECFAEMPDGKKNGGFPCPRTWDHFMGEARSFIRRHGGRGKGEKHALENIKAYANIILGHEVGLKLASYYQSLVQGADPIAQNAIVHGKFNKKEVDEKYGGGKSAPQQDFGYQLAVACADYAVQMIRNDKDNSLTEPIKRFGQVVLMLNPAEFAYAIDYFKAKLAVQVDKYCANANTKDLVKKLTTDTKVEISTILSKLEDFDADKRETLINAISDYDKLDSTRRPTRRTTR